MQRFQFRLDRVLDWRRKQCGIEESRLAACLALVHETDRKIEGLRAERAAIDREVLTRPAIPAVDFLNLGRYRIRAGKEELELGEERRQRLQSTAEQRTRVQQAQQRVKLLEKMRDRRLAEYSAAASKELEEASAEAFLVRWSQARRAETAGKSG
jgi:flagellar export protein FliJ